ncbi:MAG TPA: serine hydrolase [Candidatus Acidoferrales bacterium]|nr:serine hydrolase [Candidatus Acidoferrales bacterium]
MQKIAQRLKVFTLVVIAILALVPSSLWAQDGFTNDTAIKQFLHERFDGKKIGMVIGLVDERGSRFFGAGGLDNGTSQEANGDTVFEICSITKTFTTLLLEEMVERGEMRLDDPVAKYLPTTVKVPSRNGKEITLLELATHTSGLPRDVQTMASQNKSNPFDYTPEQLYAFLSGYNLPREPGAKFEYSNLGMGLLGHAITLKAEKDYESLVVDRICAPLHMNDTRAVLTPELKARLAAGHDASGKRMANYDFQFQAMVGCGGLRSTVNDLLKYVSAQIGLTSSSLTPLMQKTHEIRHRNSPDYGDTGMDWMDRGEIYPTNMQLLGHGGGAGSGYHTFIGFDKKQRRGVVVLCNQLGGISSETVGWFLLEGVNLTQQITDSLSSGKNGELVGIGVKLELDPESRALQITGIVPNSPAAQAGLSAGLMVQKIDDVATTGKNPTLCAALIRGKAGTKVRLELMNPKRNETNTVELMRQKFTPPKK